MRVRSAVLLIIEDCIAVIKRTRGDRVYYLLPGGGVEPGETPETAAEREANEELGVKVAIEQLVAVVHFGESLQYYYTASHLSGRFGTGTGDELSSDESSEAGSYEPVLLPIPQVRNCDVRPAKVAQLLADGLLPNLDFPLHIAE